MRNRLDTMIGCASIPMLHNGVVSGDAASQHLAASAANPSGADRVSGATAPAPAGRPFDSTLDIEPLALIQATCGWAPWVLAPAWDPDFNWPTCPC